MLSIMLVKLFNNRSLLLKILVVVLLIGFLHFLRNKRDRNNVIAVNKSIASNILKHAYMVEHRTITNETRINITNIYYRHATSARNSSFPFISGDTFRAFADYVFDETRRDKFNNLKYGDIIFVKGDTFHYFFGQMYPSITTPFVLVTHNSDFYAPDAHSARLQDTKIITWYASNPDIKHHPKLVPIPIGLANTRWPGGNLDKLMHASQNFRRPWANRSIFLYVNFHIPNNRNEREAAMTQAKTIKNVHIVTTRISFDTYLEQVGNSKFVLSPAGNGLDCHRTWEALLLGAAPIVRTSGLDALFKEIPSIILNDWSNLTEALLLSYNFSSYDNLMPTVLYARYWRERLKSHKIKMN